MRAPLLALLLALAARPAGAQTDYLVTSLAGYANGFVDNVGTSAAFSLGLGSRTMEQLASNGTFTFVADAGNNAVRLITAAGAVRRIAGGGATYLSPAGFADGAGTSDARFRLPSGVAVAPGLAGLVYVADTGEKYFGARATLPPARPLPSTPNF